MLFSFTIEAVSGLLTQYYGEVKPRIIAITLKSYRRAFFAKRYRGGVLLRTIDHHHRLTC
ncbi:hypothetical protein F0S29_06075 [Escherichia coli]|nr:hypothetical protein [Escherichia coli]EEV5816843.1 hypothetical protein [Escherichia coli]